MKNRKVLLGVLALSEGRGRHSLDSAQDLQQIFPQVRQVHSYFIILSLFTLTMRSLQTSRFVLPFIKLCLHLVCFSSMYISMLRPCKLLKHVSCELTLIKWCFNLGLVICCLEF